MRHISVVGTLFALSVGAMSVSGCTTSSRVDALDVASPSMEATSSVRDMPRPQADIAEGPVQLMPAAPVLTEAAAPQAQAAVSEPLQMVPSKPAQAQLAMVQPPQLETKAGRSEPGSVHGPRFRDAKPIRFGRVSPRHYPVHGVDVSRWQGNINWAKLKGNGANFAFIKATDGGDHVDPAFKRNWNAAAAAGVKRGAYHFFYWCRPAESQARWFIRNVPVSAGALPPVIDVEWTRSRSCKKRPSPAAVRKKMAVFMDALESHYGQRPIIYTAPDFYEDNLQGAFPNHPFWLRAVAEHPSKVYPGRKWVFWQYSGTGLSKGLAGKVDLNVFNGDPQNWQSWVERAAR